MPVAPKNKKPLPTFERLSKREPELPDEQTMTVEEVIKALGNVQWQAQCLAAEASKLWNRLGSFGITARQPETVTHFNPDDIPF